MTINIMNMNESQHVYLHPTIHLRNEAAPEDRCLVQGEVAMTHRIKKRGKIHGQTWLNTARIEWMNMCWVAGFWFGSFVAVTKCHLALKLLP